MIIGVPKEIMHGEDRVAATPETVKLFVQTGHRVLVEKSAGEGAFFCDDEYKAAGAELIDDVNKLYMDSELILKVKEPQFNKKFDRHEVDMMHEGQYLITFIHPAAPANHKMVKDLAKKGVISLTLDGVPRISRAQNMDALTSMSTCAGYKGMLIAANLVPKFIPQIFSAVGMIKPLNTLVLGTGVGGLQALATAKRLGAVCYAADIRPAAREQAASLGAKIIDLEVPDDAAIGKGGYAKALPADLLKKEREILKEHLKNMDIVFLSALVPGKLAPQLIDEDMVKQMKPGSAIIDISIDQGGNCSLTEAGESVVKYGVHIVGIKNIPGMLPASSTLMFAKNVYNLVNYLVKDNKVSLDENDEIVSGILTTKAGEIVHQGAREAMSL